MKKRKSLLIVDDDRALVEAVSLYLDEFGYIIYTAHNGRSAEIIAKDKRPDLIVLDIMLPQIDGFRVCRRLKLDQKTRNIPILMLSAKSAISDIDKSFKAHADDYLTKPFNPDRLHEKIKKLLAQGKGAGQN